MQSVVGNCWCGIFLDAYKYSTNYLLFTISVIIASILFVWIYEKPNLYKFIFKRSKHSILSPIQSEAAIEECQSHSLMRSSNTLTEKVVDAAKEEFRFERGCVEGERYRPPQ